MNNDTNGGEGMYRDTPEDKEIVKLTMQRDMQHGFYLAAIEQRDAAFNELAKEKTRLDWLERDGNLQTLYREIGIRLKNWHKAAWDVRGAIDSEIAKEAK